MPLSSHESTGTAAGSGVRPLRILHVTECFGAGVGRAVKLRAQGFPDAEHHLLWAGEETPVASEWASAVPLPRTILPRIAAIRRRVRELGPDIVHAHSSWAGVYTRTGRIGAPVVYEPHCFKFEDPSLPPPSRIAFQCAERALMARTAAVGVLSPHERAIVRGMRRDLPVVEVPNVPTIRPEQVGFRHADLRRMVMVGRIVPQKDPRFYIDVVRRLRLAGVALEAVWIGDGDAALCRLLSGAGIRVTGWLGASEIEDLLRGAVYVHSACYEGFPLSILDAAACEAPVVARRIPAIEHTGLLMASAPADVASLVERLVHDEGEFAEARARGRRLLHSHSLPHLADALTVLYSEALNP